MNRPMFGVVALLLLVGCVQNGHKSTQQISHPVEEVKIEHRMTPIPEGSTPLERSSSGHLNIPHDCELWFDGCNTCSRMEHGESPEDAMCTKRACSDEALDLAYCKTRFQY